jgi:cytochrome bd-type quinol oxidase subunit 1
MVSLAAAASAVFVVAVNGSMNAPAGFRLEGGKALDVDPIVAWKPYAIRQLNGLGDTDGNEV